MKGCHEEEIEKKINDIMSIFFYIHSKDSFLATTKNIYKRDF